jgi:uncharacterized hydrophobic protein (TIGR00271 family)
MGEREEFLGELRMGKRINSVARAAASGLLLSPGLLMLLAGSSVALVGVYSMLATLLMVVVLGLTIVNILELLGGSAERAGTTPLVQESLGALAGFFAGWSLFAGSLVLTVAIVRALSELLLLFLPGLSLAPAWLGLGLLLFLIFFQVFRFLSGRGLVLPASVLLFAVMIALLIFASFKVEIGHYQNAPASHSGDLMRSAAYLMVTYLAIGAVMVTRRQIQDAPRRLPRAMLGVLLGSAALFIFGQLVIAGIPSTQQPSEGIMLTEAMLATSGWPGWVLAMISIILLLIAANGSLMIGARQLYELSLRGALPKAFRSVRAPFRLPPVLFGSMLAIAGPLIFIGSIDELMDFAALGFLIPILLIHWTVIYSRQTEPDRRRPFKVPFFPLAPGIALALTGVMLILLPKMALTWGFGWMTLGFVFFQAYGRAHVAEAQKGVLVFGPRSIPEKKEGTYRLLVPVNTGTEGHLALELATALAHQMGGELIPLQVLVISDPLAMEEGQRLARERNVLFQWSTRFAAKSGVPIWPITRLARTVQEGILDTAIEEHCDLIFLSWAIGSVPQSARLGRVLDPVIRNAPCDVVVLGFHPEVWHRMRQRREAIANGKEEEGKPVFNVERILVTTAGGPHAPLATRLAVSLAREYGATTRGVYVVGPEPSEEELRMGELHIRQTLQAMRQQAGEIHAGELRDHPEEEMPFESQVISAKSVLEGIAKAGEDSDLVLIGASEESLIDQVLFGTLPEEVARHSSTPVLMVKRFQGLPRFWLQRLWDTIVGALPTLSDEDRLEVYKEVRRSARPDADFFVMIALAAIIAGYGLIQGSSAVIIGGMLVAPLFSPILAISLAIVRGDVRLLRVAVEATLKGIVMAIGVAVLIALISPLENISSEILARVKPDLFDLAVALASGAAGAYAIARKDVAAALPGVAIAAALVPPLCVVGIGLAIAEMQIAGGGALLFLTNLVAIVLAGAVTLLLLGFRPTEHGERTIRFRQGLVVSSILLAIITIPLAIVFARTMQYSAMSRAIDRIITEEVDAEPQMELLSFDFEKTGGQVDVNLKLYAQEAPSSVTVGQWKNRISDALGLPVRLDVISIKTTKVESALP